MTIEAKIKDSRVLTTHPHRRQRTRETAKSTYGIPHLRPNEKIKVYIRPRIDVDILRSVLEMLRFVLLL